MADTSDKSVPALAAELWDLVRAYIKQETVEPIKGLGRRVGFGVAGSLMLSIGVVMLTLGGLRALQTETDVFEDNWTWVPYLITLAGLLVLIGLSVKVGMKKRKQP